MLPARLGAILTGDHTAYEMGWIDDRHIVGITGAAMTAVGAIRLTLHHRSGPQSSAFELGINSRGLFAAGSF